MKRYWLLVAVALLVGCAEKHPYSGTIADAERAISANPMGLTFLFTQAQGDNWIRYRIVHNTSGIYLTNRTATVRVEGGRVSIAAPAQVRQSIREALKVK